MSNFVWILTVLFIGLKMTNNLDWYWIWVVSPLWIGYLVYFVYFFIEGFLWHFSNEIKLYFFEDKNK